MTNGAAAPAQKEDLFGIVAELEGQQKQLVLLDLTFGRLIDEIVVPYEEDQPFFILETAVEAYVQAQRTEPKGFSTAPQFTKMVNSSMASNG